MQQLEYGVAVVGGGHAGVEAALAAARLGVRTVLFSIAADAIANMPCNPSIGGTAKGHLVREIDALGGEMGKAADETTIQSRMLNRGKGPAVHSLRAQIDRTQYHARMKRTLENQPLLDIRQAEIIRVERVEDGRLRLVTRLETAYLADAAVICTGTYLGGKIYVGDACYESGPDHVMSARALTGSLRALGVELRRFKTGTPARVHRRSIDFSKLEEQVGDEPVTPFSFQTTRRPLNRAVCHIAYTNEETHRVILENIHTSPLYGGKIEGIGPRYCPSIEDKVMRFRDKPRHQIFVEPMGMDTQEMYLQGMSSSLPEEVQLAFLKTISGFEHIEVIRNAYAIEYDCCDPLSLLPTLEFIHVRGLFGAGQFNGTSGYEEAAAQGLVAGIGAARRSLGKEPVVLPRSGSYIGTLIDDLVTKGANDPYRMMTSRSEYRLFLRQDNADARLTPLGYELGLISPARFAAFEEKMRQIEGCKRLLHKTIVAPSDALDEVLAGRATATVQTGIRLDELLKRPQLSIGDLMPFCPALEAFCDEVREESEIEIKYKGYIDKQLSQIEGQKRMEQRRFPPDIDYRQVRGLRLEAIEKLDRVRPVSIGQASRISGVSPADISVLLLYLGRGGDSH